MHYGIGSTIAFCETFSMQLIIKLLWLILKIANLLIFFFISLNYYKDKILKIPQACKQASDQSIRSIKKPVDLKKEKNGIIYLF
jgi:hypothetical protein